MPTTINVLDFAAIAVPATIWFAVGWFAATLRLNRKRAAVKSQVNELKRLTDWTTTHKAPNEPEPWPEPLSPRAHERAAAAVDAAPELDLEPTEAIVGAHAAPVAEPDWHRGENRTLTWRWWIEIAARVASIGYKPRLVEHLPAHAAWTSDDDAAVATLVATETKRRQSALERGIAQVLDDVIHMGGAR